jgi:nucleoside-diphosphate-sugar epimerase
MLRFPRIALIGGAGYVGSALAPALLAAGYRVKVLDLFIYGEGVFANCEDRSRLSLVRVDIRDSAALSEALRDVDAVIHLACISNDPSFELDPALGKSINFDAFPALLGAVRRRGVKRFIYASSSSVYGVQQTPRVVEETPCEPITDYSRFKLMCEGTLRAKGVGDGEFVIVRPATVCGYAPRLRLDLTVNLLTIHGLVRGAITVFGGSQERPNIHMADIVEAYRLLLEAPAEAVDRETFNVGYENLSVSRIADLVRAELNDPRLTIRTEPTNDLRSYRVNSDKIARKLGFRPARDVRHAVREIRDAYVGGRLVDPLENPAYYNVKMMRTLDLRRPVPGARPVPS